MSCFVRRVVLKLDSFQTVRDILDAVRVGVDGLGSASIRAEEVVVLR